MRPKVLPLSFFNRTTSVVARELLGKFLVRSRDGKEEAFQITEVEVYDGFKDKGSHASRGKTKRNALMFGKAGYWYVYFTYGMHWMLNIVTREEEYPAAILIRGVDGINGPARLTKKLAIDGALNGFTATKKNGLWIEDRGVVILSRQIKKGPRVGIAYAGEEWAAKPWRFWIED
jgi:DNA-3-methyladenine glycosylase